MVRSIRFVLISLVLLSSYVVNAQNSTTATIRLKKNQIEGKCLLTQEMMGRPSSTYIIRYSYDLNGATLVVPKGCNLKFKKKGCISNGSIVFSDTWLRKERFYNIKTMSGKLINTEYDAQRYGFVDDTEKLAFLLSQAKNGYILHLESREYTINSLAGKKRVPYDAAFASIINGCRIKILGDRTVISDAASASLIDNYLYSFLLFESCSDVEVKGIQYKWQDDPVLDPKVKGITFIRTRKECSRFDIDVAVFNCGRGVYSGVRNDFNNNPGRGLCDSHIIVNAETVGYPIAIERGDNLIIHNTFNTAHRGTYLAGVTNSIIYVNGCNAFSTNVNLLLTDTRNGGGSYFCDNINAIVTDTGSPLSMGKVIMCQTNTYALEESYPSREPFNVKNICIEIHTPKESQTSFEAYCCSDMAKIGDCFNVKVTGRMEDSGTNSRLARFIDVPSGTFTFEEVESASNYVVTDESIPNETKLIFRSCPNISISLFAQPNPSNAQIVFDNCTFKRMTRVDKAGKNYYPKIVIKTEL